MAEDESLTIGEVINGLRDEFPDVTVSKVRFLESQGLLAPGRSDGGYRMFDEEDVDRLRFILREQRDHFLPLKVIKSKLTLWERGEDPSSGDARAGSGIVPPPETGTVSRAEIMRRSNLSPQQLDALIDHRMIEPLVNDEFREGALAVAIEARHLFSLGLEARHLRAIRHAAERQADILGQLTVSLRRVRSAETQEQARNILSGAGEAMVAIHRALLSEELRRMLDR